MAASILNTPRAIQVSVLVVRAFVGLRALADAHRALAHKIKNLERTVRTRQDTEGRRRRPATDRRRRRGQRTAERAYRVWPRKRDQLAVTSSPSPADRQSPAAPPAESVRPPP